MNRVDLVTHKNKKIVRINLSKCQPEETLLALPEAKRIIAGIAPKSGLVLTDVTDAVYNQSVAEAIKDFVRSNQPYVKASAVVGAEGVRLVLLTTVILLTRREIKTFSNQEQAKEWLSGLA
jgi:hypothetical protein